MLVEHEAHQDFIALLTVENVGVITLSSIENISPFKEVRNDVGVLDAGVFRLNVEGSTLVLNIMVVSWKHGSSITNNKYEGKKWGD